MLTDYHSHRLPRLRELAFSTEHAEDVSAFLEIHGTNLNVLAPHGQSGGEFPPLLSLCPNITELHLCSVDLVSGVLACRRSSYVSETLVQPENVPFVAESAPHAALKRVACPSFIIGYVVSYLERFRACSPALFQHPGEAPRGVETMERLRRLPQSFQAQTSCAGGVSHLRHEMAHARVSTLRALCSREAFGEMLMPSRSAYHVSRYTQLALDLHELDIAFADKDGTRWTRFDPLRLSLKPFR